MMNSFCNCLHMIVPITLVVSKNLRRSGRLGGFVVSIWDRFDRLKGKRRAVVSYFSGMDNRILFGEWTSCLAIECFYIIHLFFDFSALQAKFILDYCNKSDRPDRPSRLIGFPYDRFKIYTIVPTQLYPSDRGRLRRPGSLQWSE